MVQELSHSIKERFRRYTHDSASAGKTAFNED